MKLFSRHTVSLAFHPQPRKFFNMASRNKKPCTATSENIPPTDENPPQDGSQTKVKKPKPKKTNFKTVKPPMAPARQAKRTHQLIASTTDSDSDGSMPPYRRPYNTPESSDCEEGEVTSDTQDNSDESQEEPPQGVSSSFKITKMLKEIKRNQLDTNSKVSELAQHIDNPETIKHQWKKEGLKIQHEIAHSVVHKTNLGISAMDSKKYRSARQYLIQGKNTLLERMKDLRIADSSEAGWETVNVYKTHPVADDAEDDRRIRKAERVAKERLAAKAKKGRQQPRNNNQYEQRGNQNYRREFQQDTRDDYPKSDRYHYYKSNGSSGSQDQNQRSSYSQDNRRSNQRKPSSNDLCFYCGLTGHWQESCPSKYSRRH